MKEDLSPRNIQRALDELKSMLQAERTEANTRAQQVELRRRGNWSREDFPIKKVEEDLAASQKLLEEQRQVNAQLQEQLAAEREATHTQLATIESTIQALQEESEAAQKRSRAQKALALHIIQAVELERDELRAQLNEQQAKTRQMEEELEACRKQLQQHGREEGRRPLAGSDWKVSDRSFLLHVAEPCNRVQ